MKRLNFVKSALFASAIVAISGLTAGFTSASQSVSVQAEVPLVCRVSLAGGSSDFNAQGQASLGLASEFCNSSNGYRVFARADGVTEGASIIVDGVRFPLQSGAEFQMASSPTPNILNRNIIFDAGNTDGGGRLSLRIVAN